MTEKSKDKVYEDSISNWPEEERPRERLLKFGPHSLTNAELLAILLRVGVKGKSAVDLVRQIIREAKSFSYSPLPSFVPLYELVLLQHVFVPRWLEKGLLARRPDLPVRDGKQPFPHVAT